MANTCFEYRGVSDLILARVVRDTEDDYSASVIGQLAPVATIARETATNSKTSYYDNLPMVVITSTGSDTFQLTISVPSLSTLASITGQTYYGNIGAMIEGDRNDSYWAIGYKYQGTDGRTRYSWRYKGQFSTPSETYNTKDDGTDTGNVTLTYTSIATTYKFERTGKGAKGIVVDDSLGKIDYNTFLDTVKTPDNLSPSGSGGIEAPEFLPSSPIFSGTLHVTLGSATPNVSIKYTTDGTDPKTSDTAQSYNAANGITLTATTTIMAYAYAGGSMAEPSETVMKTYTKS